MRTITLYILLAVFAFTANTAQADSLYLNWEISGFSMPESVFASPDHEWLYVSNVNGKGKGFISRLTKDGALDSLKWVKELGSPTGMGLHAEKLYVADQTKLHVIDVHSAQRIRTIVAPSAKALNDVAVSDTGQVFISDIFDGKIYTLQDDKLIVWLDVPQIPYPNGVLVQGNNLIVANWGITLKKDLKRSDFGSLYRVNLISRKVEVIASSTKLGRLDGIAHADNGLLVSHHLAGELYFINTSKRILLGTFPVGLADIGSDDQAIYTPLLIDNKVASYKMPTQ